MARHACARAATLPLPPLSGGSLLFARLLSVLPAGAPDAPGSGPFYVDLFGGIAAIDDNAIATGNDPGGPVLQTVFLDHDQGVYAGLRLGGALGQAWRGDVELSFRRNALDDLTSPGNIITPGCSFDIDTTALMANGHREFRPLGAVTPDVGAGLGRASVRAAGSIAPGDATFDHALRQTVPAAPQRLGATVAVSDRLDLGLEWTHFRAFDIDATLSPDFCDTLTEDYVSDAVSVLVRLRF